LLYIYTLYGSLAFLIFELLERYFKKVDCSQSKQKQFLSLSAALWFIYLLVPIVTILTGDNYSKTISLFAYIPTFMVDHNFLPTGMMVVIPIIVISYTLFCKWIFNTSWIESFLLTTISSTIMYVLFYQYFLRLFVEVRLISNFYVTYAVYHTIMMYFLYLSVKRFTTVFNLERKYFNWFLIGNELIMFGLLIVGLYQVVYAK